MLLKKAEVSAEGADVAGIVELVRGDIPILTEQVLGWTEGSSIKHFFGAAGAGRNSTAAMPAASFSPRTVSNLACKSALRPTHAASWLRSRSRKSATLIARTSLT